MNTAYREIVFVDEAGKVEISDPHIFIQWKGTDVCMDIYCLCGRHMHFDGDFCYSIKCMHCGRVYGMPSSISLQLIDSTSPFFDGAKEVRDDEDEECEERLEPSAKTE